MALRIKALHAAWGSWRGRCMRTAGKRELESRAVSFLRTRHASKQCLHHRVSHAKGQLRNVRPLPASCRALAAAWHAWAAKVAEAEGERASMQRAGMHMRSAMLAKAWHAWAEEAQRLARKCGLAAAALRRARRSLMGLAWGSWAEAAAHARRKAGKTRMAVRFSRQRSLAAAWAAWRESARESAQDSAAAALLRHQVRVRCIEPSPGNLQACTVPGLH